MPEYTQAAARAERQATEPYYSRSSPAMPGVYRIRRRTRRIDYQAYRLNREKARHWLDAVEPGDTGWAERFSVKDRRLFPNQFFQVYVCPEGLQFRQTPNLAAFLSFPIDFPKFSMDD